MNIIQWNTCGIKPKVRNGDVSYLMKNYNCPILVTQETKLPHEAIFRIKGYKSYLKSLPINEGEKSHGGVGIFVKNFASSYEIPLNTVLQAVAVSVKITQRITICSIYLPPDEVISKEEIQNVLNQLPKPFMILGDFNAHHPLWYDTRPTDRRGDDIVDIIAENDIGLLDGNKPTAIWNVDKSSSHIDLSIVSSELLDTFYWNTYDETMNSDHYPIILKTENKIEEERPPRWILDKAKLDRFQQLAILEEELNEDQSVDEATMLIENCIKQAAEKTIPQTSGTRSASNPAWWNTRCRQAINKRKATFRKFNKVATPENFTSYKKARALARREVIRSKEESWSKFLESINNKTSSKEVWRRIRILLNKYHGEKLTTLKLNQPEIKISNIPIQIREEILTQINELGCIQTIETENNEEISTITIRFEQNIQELILDRYDGKVIGDIELKAEVIPIQQPKILDEPIKIANVLGKRFNYISSSKSRPEFKEIQTEKEKEDFDFTTNLEMKYNMPITEDELNQILKHSKDTTPGSDGICYSMIKNLNITTKQQFLNLLNKIFNEGTFPSKWKEAEIIPILKGGKEATDPTGYRPIALTSCACKILEKILNRRLLWFLESKGYLHKNLSGFRKGRSTIDSLATLINQVYAAFRNKQYVLGVFLDLEKAYDTCWRHLIMKELHRYGLKGKLPILISDYLKNRTFKVKIGLNTSEIYAQETGVPQGGVLSCTLFNIAMNTVMKELSGLVSSSIYVDDIRISYANTNPTVCKTRIQVVLNKLQEWATNNGFKFNTTKTEWMFFYRNIREPVNVNLTMYGKELKKVENKQFLGIILDRMLNWKPHIENLKAQCLRDINILYVISNKNKSITPRMIIRTYKSIIQSRLEYGCEVLGTAPTSYLKSLDCIHHKALRISLGAFPTTPIESLYALTGETSLSIRRTQLMIQYYVRTKQFLPHERPINLDDRTMDEIYKKTSNKPKGIGYSIRNQITENEIIIPQVATLGGTSWCGSSMCTHENCLNTPWNPPTVTTCLDLAVTTKQSLMQDEWNQIFLQHKHNTDMEVYTDGSKMQNDVGSACVIIEKETIETIITRKLPHQASVYTAELTAIKLALEYLKHKKNKNFTIYTDSLSAVISVKNRKTNHLVTQIHYLTQYLRTKNNNITICWIPGHVGIAGNVMADKKAKEVLSRNNSITQPISVQDIKAYIKNKFRNKSKKRYEDIEPGRLKLKTFQTNYRTSPPELHLERKSYIKIIRLQIGHTALTHSYILEKENRPRCTLCAEFLTVSHILKECEEIKSIRDKYIPEEIEIKDMLTHPYIFQTIGFLKDLQCFKKI